MAQLNTTQENPTTPPQSPCSITNNQTLFIRIMSKRRTWALLFISVYSLLLSSSWNLLQSVLSWYNSSVSASSNSFGWPAVYASMALGGIFGLLAMAAALAVAVPATLMTWITVLVLLTFCGKPRKSLVVEGKKLTGEIFWVLLRVLIREGKFVAAVCAVLGYFALVRNIKEP
ncbi:Thioredoxin M-type [Heracleum sosnowskyi]|uniref:Thioredoxin M-type n=1 Tax=Heracleum sosnowskyi TaxID=360622 RepID=A0AAD8NEM5_9APIA|nr:Thioredoxin M-type [Heracleum sosnowskyi]